ncbi:MAG: 16S rRNA (cytosine(967)-C(5))-methyltransferase RsmB [Steroidobacteraceae bacterium]
MSVVSAQIDQGQFAPGAATLAAAVVAVSAVAHEGYSVDVALQAAEERADRSAVRAIALGTLRWYLRLAPVVSQLVSRPGDQVAPHVRALLITAAHQIEYSRAAPEVSVHLAVDAARVLGLARAAGFVNAVLRRFVRERAGLFESAEGSLAVRHAHPQWLVDRLQQDWPARASSVLAAANEHPPMVLRIDTRRVTREAYRQQLDAMGRASQPVTWLPDAIVLERSVPVATLPGFEAGLASVQDAGAQWAAWLLDLAPGQRVLDACAAPGGKSAHILQREPDVSLLAIDNDAERLSRVAATFSRIGQRAELQRVDLLRADALASEAPFDRILLDAPCSSTGVIRRHPDIKLLRRSEDIANFARVQRALLHRCFERLAPGGRLVYATCSVLDEENETVVRSFLGEESRARRLDWPTDTPIPPDAQRLPIGTQLLPGDAAGTDGFYYACLGRESSA